MAGIYTERGESNGDQVTLAPGESVLYLAYGHPSLGDPRRQIDAALEEARQRDTPLSERKAPAGGLTSGQDQTFPFPTPACSRCITAVSTTSLLHYPERPKRQGGESGLAGSFPGFQTGYHIQDSVYQALPMLNANHPELVEPMLEWFLEVLPIAKETARSVFWLKGARYIWHGGPGMLTYLPGHTHYGPCLDEHHVNGWVVLAIERYLNACGWDKDKARRYYPIVGDIARFFSSML